MDRTLRFALYMSIGGTLIMTALCLTTIAALL